jgi:hypothetical protein
VGLADPTISTFQIDENLPLLDAGQERDKWGAPQREVVVAKNTGSGKRVGLIKDRYQKKNSRTGLWDKYNKRGDYVGTKKTGGPFKSIVRLEGRNPKRG